MTHYSKPQIAAAIDIEAFQWAQHFEVTDPEQIEGRRNVMRANAAVGYLDPLLEFLPGGIEILESQYEGRDGEAAFDMQNDRAWLRQAEYFPEAFDEMIRQDAEGRT
jgi:hypothetical protein